MTRRWIINGRVQGVGFRWFVHRHARSLGLAGWVTNLPDGRVEVVGTGSPEQLERLEAALRTGPTMARVTSVESGEYQHEIGFDNTFEIR